MDAAPIVEHSAGRAKLAAVLPLADAAYNESARSKKLEIVSLENRMPSARKLAGLLCLTLAPRAAQAADLKRLLILGPNYPRVFYFRAAESAASRKTYPTYESWERNFDQLMGVMGKCLDEECQNRMARNPAFFTRFKRRHPDQVVLLHFNGHARDPAFQREGYFPGHWIYRRAARITRDVPVQAGRSVIHVSDARAFRVNIGRYGKSHDDIALFRIKDGKHDWSYCEQVKLLAVDYQANTITVRRGCYGTRPLAFQAGRARAAAHVVEGPWGRKNHLLWAYNFTTHCPRDARGRTCADALLEDFARWFGPGGPLAAFDGVEFDVMFHYTRGDTDGDGKEDGGFVNGRNHYGPGVIEFARKLRKRLGPDFIIQADGALGWGGLRSQRCWGLFNGIESEGWPNLKDWEIDDWSGGLNRHCFWRDRAFPPAFTYFNHKWVESVPGQPGRTRSVRVPFSRHRLVFAAAQMCDAALTLTMLPPQPGRAGYIYWLRDARVPAQASLAFAIGMGPKCPERSDGVWFKVFAAELTAGRPGPFEKLFEESSKQHRWLHRKVSLARYAGKMVRLKFVADCGPADNTTTDHARWGDVKIVSPGRSLPLVTRRLPYVGVCVRRQPEKPLDKRTGAWLGYQQRLDIAGETLPAYTVHPPYKRVGQSDKLPLWDEFVCGADRRLGWLGRPEGPAVRLALRAPDLLAGAGRGPALARRLRGDIEASPAPDGVRIRPAGPNAKRLVFTLPDVPTRGSDLFVSVTMKAAAMTGYPKQMARAVIVSAAGGMIPLGDPDLIETGMRLRGREEEPLDRSVGATVSVRPRTVGGKSLPTVFAHPPWKPGAGYTFWSQEVDVPPEADLRFCIGMGEKSPQRSDGVWFKVYAAVVKDGRPGPHEKIFEKSSKAYRWLPQRVSLERYAGRRVRLKFVADCGPRDDTTTDHAHWGDVKIVRRGARESEITPPQRYMTWADGKPFTSGFYFRRVRSPRVDLTFKVESTEPVVIQSITAHASPDAMCRVFEKGLVLANPGLRPYTFDLRRLSPGRRYRRLRATACQDAATNNGRLVGDRVTLDERDGLFLVRVK